MNISVKKLFTLSFNYLPAMGWAIIIYLLSAQQTLPGFDISLLDFLSKKLAHMFVYAVLFWLLFQHTKKSFHFKQIHYYWLVPLMITIIYAVSDEFHQSFVPGRTATCRDIGYDILGASLVLLKKFNYI